MGIALPLLLLLTGCGDGDDTPAPARHAAHDSGSGYAPRRVAMAPTNPAPLADDTPVDPMKTPDGLSGGMENNIGTPLPTDALTGGDSSPTFGRDAKPFADPMAEAPDGLSQSHGPAMPTQHSHWLSGSVFNARVDVRLNNLPLGTFYAPVDKDITMKCRNGVNTLTIAYTPTGSSTASAQLNVVESEHTPPIAPLAVFRSPRPQPASFTMARTGQTTPASSAALPPTTTQTFTFLAK